MHYYILKGDMDRTSVYQRRPQIGNQRFKNLCHTRCAVLLLLGIQLLPTNGWIAPHPLTSSVHKIHPITCLFAGKNENENENQGQPLDFLFNPYESKIPPDLKDEIYRAEANTPAAKDRGTRVITYALVAVVGVMLAFFNAFITELRNTPVMGGGEEDPLAAAGLDWINTNLVANFLFTNKIGGGICLLGGAGAGLLAEAELDTKRINAEKIFEEMERRRLQKGQKQQKQQIPKDSKKRRSGKEKKRLQALSEIVEVTKEEEKGLEDDTKSSTESTTEKSPVEADETKSKSKQEGEGFFGKIKGFYEKADTMAAAQARILNKELEEQGLLEKITDETGYKVIGREEAAKAAKNKTQDEFNERKSNQDQ